MRFKDKVCIVSGAGSGIGRSVALRLASEGGFVAVLDINEENGNETIQLMGANKEHGIFINTDVSDSSQVQRCINVVINKWKRIDVIVNNAAMMTFKPLLELSETDWNKVLAVNLTSVFLFTRYSVPHMNGGVIINVGSVHAHDTTPNVLPYSVSKAAIEAFGRGMSLEFPSEKVRVVCVAPGAVDTPMLWSNPNVKSGKEKIEGKIGKPEDIASAICYLASEEAGYINGTTLVVDGGRLNIL